MERERSLEESKDAIEAKLVEIYSEKDHVTFALDQTLKKLQIELQEITSVRHTVIPYCALSLNVSLSVYLTWCHCVFVTKE